MRTAMVLSVLAPLLLGAAATPERPANAQPGSGAPAGVLSVTMSCQSDASLCEAIASGGTGGYTWTWYGADETGGEEDSSVAVPHCWGNSEIRVRVQVTDGNAAFATTSRLVSCP
jgi:hypothetical protein